MIVVPKETDNRVAIVLPYYGSLPKWFNLFLTSLEGKIFDVLFVSDIRISKCPKNFRQIEIDFASFKALLEKRLESPVTLPSAYRLCDFRPMYGMVFEEFLKDYDYWGWGDCDLVYGARMNMLVRDLLSRGSDVISCAKLWVSGCFALLRNDETCRYLYLKARDIERVYQAESNQVFDEIGGWWHHALQNGSVTLEDCSRRNDNFTSIVTRSGVRYFHENVICERKLKSEVVLMGSDGRLWIDDEEIPLFHFHEIKHGIFEFGHPRCRPIGEIRSYRITRHGFFCSRLAWSLRYAIIPYRWARYRISILKFYLAHARKVGVLRTVSSLYRWCLGKG